MAVWPDWYCCIAVALDAEEESWHNQQFLAYIGAGGDPKKFPKKKKRIIPESREEEEGPRPHDIVMGALSRSGVNMVGRKGDIDEYAKTRGLKKVYKLPDGLFVDEDGNPVEPTPGSVFVEKN